MVPTIIEDHSDLLVVRDGSDMSRWIGLLGVSGGLFLMVIALVTSFNTPVGLFVFFLSIAFLVQPNVTVRFSYREQEVQIIRQGALRRRIQRIPLHTITGTEARGVTATENRGVEKFYIWLFLANGSQRKIDMRPLEERQAKVICERIDAFIDEPP